MTQENVHLMIPFQVIVEFIKGFSIKDKRQLWALLDEEIAQAASSAGSKIQLFRLKFRKRVLHIRPMIMERLIMSVF